MGATYNLFTTDDDQTTLGARHITAKTKAVSGTSTYYSSKMLHKDNQLGFSIQFVGTMVGTLTLWWSDLELPDVADDDDWIQDASWSPTNPAGSDIKTKYGIGDLKGRWARLKYVNASGSGTVAAQAVIP